MSVPDFGFTDAFSVGVLVFLAALSVLTCSNLAVRIIDRYRPVRRAGARTTRRSRPGS